MLCCFFWVWCVCVVDIVVRCICVVFYKLCVCAVLLCVYAVFCWMVPSKLSCLGHLGKFGLYNCFGSLATMASIAGLPRTMTGGIAMWWVEQGVASW